MSRQQWSTRAAQLGAIFLLVGVPLTLLVAWDASQRSGRGETVAGIGVMVLVAIVVAAFLSYRWAVHRRWIILTWGELPVSVGCVAWRSPDAFGGESQLMQGHLVIAPRWVAYFPARSFAGAGRRWASWRGTFPRIPPMPLRSRQPVVHGAPVVPLVGTTLHNGLYLSSDPRSVPQDVLLIVLPSDWHRDDVTALLKSAGFDAVLAGRRPLPVPWTELPAELRQRLKLP